tara:strand:+ start:9699 stop:10310 length:612 start_codon:yes stop_codon:yes gene_type:complete
METFNQDPKPGRLVLPLVLIGMIATTYTFVNRVVTNNDLDVSVVQEEITPVEETETDDTTTTSTTTTTLPVEVVTYLEEIQGEKVQSDELGQKVLEANERWDDELSSYQEAKDEFAKFIEDAEQFANTISEPGPPDTFANLVTSHEELTVLANLIYEDTKELLEGLTSSDTGERRASALDSFNKNLALLQQKIEETIASATSS